MTSEPDSPTDGDETAIEDPESVTEDTEASPLADARSGRMAAISRATAWSSANGRPILLVTLVIAAMVLATGVFFLQYRPDRQLDDAAARSDGNGVRELAGQLTSTTRGSGGPAILALHLDVMQRLARSVLAGALDPLVATAAADSLMESFLARVGPAAGKGATGAPDAIRDAYRWLPAAAS